MLYSPDLVAELDILTRYRMGSTQEGIKVHKDADPAIIAAVMRLHEKGLVTQGDGGYLTDMGHEAAEHAQALFAILSST